MEWMIWVPKMFLPILMISHLDQWSGLMTLHVSLCRTYPASRVPFSSKIKGDSARSVCRSVMFYAKCTPSGRVGNWNFGALAIWASDLRPDNFSLDQSPPHPHTQKHSVPRPHPLHDSCKGTCNDHQAKAIFLTRNWRFQNGKHCKPLDCGQSRLF